jgi:hypothetical protein
LENWRRKNMSFYPKKEIYKKGFGRFSINRRLGDNVDKIGGKEC